MTQWVLWAPTFIIINSRIIHILWNEKKEILIYKVLTFFITSSFFKLKLRAFDRTFFFIRYLFCNLKQFIHFFIFIKNWFVHMDTFMFKAMHFLSNGIMCLTKTRLYYLNRILFEKNKQIIIINFHTDNHQNKALLTLILSDQNQVLLLKSYIIWKK